MRGYPVGFVEVLGFKDLGKLSFRVAAPEGVID